MVTAVWRHCVTQTCQKDVLIRLSRQRTLCVPSNSTNVVETVPVGFLSTRTLCHSSVSCSLRPAACGSQEQLPVSRRYQERDEMTLEEITCPPLFYLDMLIFRTTPSSVIAICVQRHNTPLPFLSPPPSGA